MKWTILIIGLVLLGILSSGCIGEKASTETVAQMKAEKDVEGLIKAMLNSSDDKIRAEAAHTLGEIEDERAVEPLIQALKDEDSDVREAAEEALEKLGWKARSLSTGTFIVKKLSGGNGELTIKNGLSSDGVAVLSKSIRPKVPLSSVYIQSEDSYTIKDIPNGVYILYFAVGKDWDSDSKKFTIAQSYERFEEELEFETTRTARGIEYMTFTVTLHPVAGGTAETETVSEGDFPELS